MVRARPNERRGRTTAIILVLGLFVAVVSGGSTPAALASSSLPVGPARGAQDGDPQRGELQTEYDEVLAEEQQLVEELDRLSADRERVGAELAQLETDVVNSQASLEQARADLAAAEEAERASIAAREQADEEVARSTERLRQQAVAAFVIGGDDMDVMGAVLRADTISDADTAITYSKVVLGDTDALVQEHEEALAKRREAEAAAVEAKTLAATHHDEVENLTAFITTARDQSQALATELDVATWNETLKLQEIQGRRTLVEARITAMDHASDGVAMLLAAVQADQPDWTPGAIVITTPIPGHRIGSPYGLRHHPILGITRLHAGGDIGAAAGTPIHAAADGMVVFAGERGGYGNTVIIDHGHSLGTLYGHQSSIDVETGDLVLRGQVIGYVGSTGLSTGPHLHFETRLKGLPADPADIVDWDAVVDYGES